MEPAHRRQVANCPSSSLAVEHIDLSIPTQCRFCRVICRGDTTIIRQRWILLGAWYGHCAPGIARTPKIRCLYPSMNLDDGSRDRVDTYLHQRDGLQILSSIQPEQLHLDALAATPRRRMTFWRVGTTMAHTEKHVMFQYRGKYVFLDRDDTVDNCRRQGHSEVFTRPQMLVGV